MSAAPRKSGSAGVRRRWKGTWIVSRACHSRLCASALGSLVGGGTETYLEYLDAQGDAVPVRRAVDVLGRVDVEQELEGVQPGGEDRLCGLLDRLWVLLLDHEQSFDACPEYPDCACTRKHAVLLHTRSALSSAPRDRLVRHIPPVRQEC